ncbi:MAG: flagellar hook protein FlgE [Terracidiphilus sp.]|nr:flagellar hook protein FlgE [Terracidiphilus sp.]
MASFYIPLSGLNADSTALNTIANDLSNMNTTAFKSQTTNFSDMFYQQIGSNGAGNQIQQGEGVQVASNSTNFTQGGYNTDGTTTSDVALDGSGFFVVSDGSSNLLTRDGSFTQDSSGNLVTAGGLKVMGYPAVDGVVNTNASITAISIPVTGAEQKAEATTSFTMTANLDSATGDSLPGTVTLYDSLGTAHTATITYTQTGTNTWSYSAALPAADFTSGTSTAVTGTLTFDSNGNLSQVAQTTPTAVAATTVGTASGDISSIPLSYTGLSDGASDLSISWNLLGSSGTPTISQEATASKESASSPNGHAAGVCTGFSIDSDGTVSATYSSGVSEAVGQLAVASVTNQQGLSLQGNGDYTTTLASGSATVGTAGSGGLGTIKDSALEESNVNISAAFSDLIIAQRGFEANSKAITTFDTITQETINMIH